MADEQELPREALDDLRAAWRSQRPAPPADDLSETDAATRAAVELLRRAWSELQVPAPRIPAGRLHRPRFGRALDLLAAGLAAGLLVALAWSVARDRVDRLPVEAQRSGPHVAGVHGGNVELRSGPVTLVLVRPGGEAGMTR